jgi:hypothetical protein
MPCSDILTLTDGNATNDPAMLQRSATSGVAGMAVKQRFLHQASQLATSAA